MHFMVPLHVVHDLDGLQINSEVVEPVKYQMNESSSGEGSTTSSAPTTKHIPEHAEVPHVACAPTSGLAPNSLAQPKKLAQLAPVPSSGSNANALKPVPRGLPNIGSNAADGGILDFLSKSPQPMLLELGMKNHHLLELINEPVEWGKGLRYELKLPVLCLIDCDPYGSRIMTTYKYGAKNMAADDCKMVIRDMKWLVICLADLEKFEIPEDVMLPISEDALGQVKTCQRNHL
ncbi:hypothetical protein Vadar_013474 [Vaccinium darrowii]|uniref:Uncharacterized protein n=1 Tax=Vaccinium darrowii TaxID=229202 RepID=A0ACB7XQF5_9ERIC|nr:hypothetical protein Vadar_013474 [Vaccinium darrowii]